MHHIEKDLSYDRCSVDFSSTEFFGGFLALSCRLYCDIMVILIELIHYFMLLFLLLLLIFSLISFHSALGRDTHTSLLLTPLYIYLLTSINCITENHRNNEQKAGPSGTKKGKDVRG